MPNVPAARGLIRCSNGVPERAYALLGQGRCLTILGDPAADQPLRQARALLDQMGARPRVAKCDTLIAQAGRRSS